MLQDPFTLLAIFDDLHKTRTDLQETLSSFEEKVRGIEETAETIDAAIRRWQTDVKGLAEEIGRDVHQNGYAALEKYVDEVRDDAKAKAANSLKESRTIADNAVADLRALAANQQEAFNRQLRDVAAAVNGLPPLPPRPIESTVIALCAYHVKASVVRVRRFCIEARSVAVVVSAIALVVIAAQSHHGMLSLSPLLAH
jgi:hypothetical protein